MRRGIMKNMGFKLIFGMFVVGAILMLGGAIDDERTTIVVGGGVFCLALWSLFIIWFSDSTSV